MVRREILVPALGKGSARMASDIVQLAAKFPAEIALQCDNKHINAKSMMGVLSLGLTGGEMLGIEARGTQAKEAVDALEQLITNGHE